MQKNIVINIKLLKLLQIFWFKMARKYIIFLPLNKYICKLTVWYLCILNPLSWPLGITLGTCAFGVDLPLSGGDTTSKCCIVGIFILPDLKKKIKINFVKPKYLFCLVHRRRRKFRENFVKLKSGYNFTKLLKQK